MRCKECHSPFNNILMRNGDLVCNADGPTNTALSCIISLVRKVSAQNLTTFILLVTNVVHQKKLNKSLQLLGKK